MNNEQLISDNGQPARIATQSVAGGLTGGNKNEGGQIGGQIGGQMGGPMSGPIGGPIELTERQQEIVGLIRANARVTRKELSEKLSINESAIQKHINQLKEKGAIKRIDGTRGYWEVI